MSHDLKSPQTNGLYRSQAEAITGLLLCSAPLFLVTIRGWANAVLILGALASIVFLCLPSSGQHKSQPRPLRSTAALGVTLFLPVIAVAISSALRGDFYLPAFDSPVRFCLAIPVLVFVVRTRFNASKLLQYVLPVALLITLGQQHVFHQPMYWGPDRMATYFADPLVFGYFSLTFALLSLTSINLLGQDRHEILILKAVAALIGFYLSIQSGSRTGWLALPVVMGLWIYRCRSTVEFGRMWFGLGFGLIGLTAIIFFLALSENHSRFGLVVEEIAAYPWDGVAPETSVGLRITFLRIAWDLFLQSPWVGYGETRFVLSSIPLSVHSYASPVALSTALNSGFHNEIVTNAVRSGIWGFMSGVCLFFVPLLGFFQHLKSARRVQRANAMLGICFVVCMLSSSLSTEILDLKYTASFYALMIAILYGSTIADHE